MILDLSLANAELWKDLKTQSLAGKLTLVAPPEEAIPVLAARVAALAVDPDEVELTGGMAIWAYLVAFHALHGRTRRIYYRDGLGQRLLVAAHG